jgi:Protein of unknown function (DUF5818)
MKKQAGYLILALLVSVGLSLAAGRSAAKHQTFSGEISDSTCGLHHMMPGGAKKCTLECVGMGGQFVLADHVHNKVYKLSDQKTPKQFAGRKVKVTGTLKGDTIEVAKIQAAQ